MADSKNQSTNEYPHLKWFGIPQILPYAKPYRKMIVVMVLTGLFSSLEDTLYPLFNRYALDHFIGEHTTDTLPVFLALYLAMMLAQTLVNILGVYLCSKVEIYVSRDLKNLSFNHLQTLSFSYFNTNNVGYIHARVMSDTARIGNVLSWQIMDFVWDFSYVLFAFVVMLFIDWKMAGLLLLLVPIVVVLVAHFQKKLVALNRRIREINSKITGNFNEGITGARTIRTLVVADRIQEDFEKDTDDMQRTSVRATHNGALFTSGVTMMSMVALSIVLWYGGSLTMQNMMRIGTISVFMSYALGMMEPIQFVVQTFSVVINAQVNIERLMRLIGTESDVKDSPEVVEKYGDTFHPKKENWEELHGDIEFRDVSFHYPDGEEMVLEHFNLKVPQGTNVAIVGETGAGKSTLVNLVCRFFEPTGGQVLIDGKDARLRSQLWLHSNIGYVLQTPHLFSGTVRDNLRYGKPDATDEEIWAALNLVSAADVVERMGDGLSSEVGEGGDLLSTGEKQLLSFARAILADPAILVLDEATSSIDTETEKKIQDAITTVIKGRTSFMIAHRLSTVVDADVILVVHDGKIIEQGRHEGLMEKQGYYYRLYTRQYEDAAMREEFSLEE